MTAQAFRMHFDRVKCLLRRLFASTTLAIRSVGRTSCPIGIGAVTI
jgi:hypothetical protein